MLEFLQNNDLIAALIAFGIVLIPAIIIHEFGHFFAAKWVGITVLEFGIGFPPRLLKLFRWGETEFTLNWIPLGGFVRPLGEGMVGPKSYEETEREREELAEWYDEEDEEQYLKSKNEQDVDLPYLSEREELRQRGVRDADMMAVHEAKPLPRIFFMAAGAIANFVSAIIIFIIIGMIGVPHFVGARVQMVDIGTTLQSINEGDAIERVNGQLFGSLSELLALVAQSDSEFVQLEMLDVSDNSTYSATVPVAAFDVEKGILVSGVAENSPAADAGLLPDDFIVAVNGEDLNSLEDSVTHIQTVSKDLAGEEVELTIMRDGEIMTLNVVPRSSSPGGEGRIGISIREQFMNADGLALLESTPQQELVPLPFGEAVVYGFEQFFEVIRLIISIPAQIIGGTISPEEARPVSIIGISQVGGQLIQNSIQEGTPRIILNFVALVSIFLGFTNLLPIPALDGGRIMFVIIEIVRGRPIPPELEGKINLIAMMILLSVGVLIMLYDVINPFVLP